MPVTLLPASAAPLTAPSAAPAAAPANTAFNASLALLRIPVARFFPALRPLAFLAAPLLAVRLEAAAFLEAVVFERDFEADLFELFFAAFFAGIFPPMKLRPQEATLPH